MRCLMLVGVLTGAASLAQLAPPQIVLPPGTKILSELVNPVWTKSSRPGDVVHVESTLPVALDNKIAIPPGTYFEGPIDILIKPHRTSDRAEFRIRFTQLVFANGYTVTLDSAIATVTVRVSGSSEILLDRDAPLQLVLYRSLQLDAASVVDAVGRSRLSPAPRQSAAVCKAVPGMPGSPDTIVPGTPATPPTVIPGPKGMPDTVFPGTPGTDPVVIPASSRLRPASIAPTRRESSLSRQSTWRPSPCLTPPESPAANWRKGATK